MAALHAALPAWEENGGGWNQRNEWRRRLVLLFCQQCHWAGHFGTDPKTWIWTFVTDWLQYESTPPICFDCAASAPMANKDRFDCVQAVFFYRLDRPRYYNSVHLSLSSFIGCTATVTSLSLEHFRSITWNLFLSIGQHLMRWITIIKIHMMSEQLELIGGQFFWWPERTVIFQSLEDVYLKVLSCWFQSEGTFIARGPTGHIIT